MDKGTARETSHGRHRPVTPEEKTFLDLLRTASALSQRVAEVLRPYGLTPTQYNVLRILRGASEPLTCGETADRMISRDPDATRLLDRLEKQGLTVRSRSVEDRRVVVTELTEAGRKLVDELDEPVERLHKEQLGHLGEEKLEALTRLLEEAQRGIR